MGDWGEPWSPVGEIPPYTQVWAETAILLAWVEVPGLYVQPDTGLVYAIDHVEATGHKTADGFEVTVGNPTPYEARVRVLCESSSEAKKPLGFHALRGKPVLVLKPGESKRVTMPGG